MRRARHHLHIGTVSEKAGIDDGVRDARQRGEHPASASGDDYPGMERLDERRFRLTDLAGNKRGPFFYCVTQ
jgi:hypothetical protein